MRETLARRMRLLEALENPVSLGAALVITAWYVWYRYQHGVIADLSWSIPFFGIAGASKFAFAFLETRTDNALRALDRPEELPAARVVAAASPALAPLPVTAAAPPAPAPAQAPGDEPALLK